MFREVSVEYRVSLYRHRTMTAEDLDTMDKRNDSPPMSDQATSDFCKLISRRESGTKSTCAASKSAEVKVN